MSRTCDLSGKSTSFGGNRKHRRGSSGSGGAWAYKSQRTSRKWKPNLRKARVQKDGKTMVVKIAMSIYKKLRKGESYKGYTLVSHHPAA